MNTHTKGGTDVVIEKAAVKPPPLYKVILHNDDYTPRDFVVMVIERVFHKSTGEAEVIMLHAHRHGLAVAGLYAFEIAESKVEQVTAIAKEAEFPLLCTMEPEDG